MSRVELAPDTHADTTPVRRGVRRLCRHWARLNSKTRAIGRGPPRRHVCRNPLSLRFFLLFI